MKPAAGRPSSGGQSAASRVSGWRRERSSRSWRTLLAFVLIPAGLLAAPDPAPAQQPTDGAVLLILDASGSMNRTDEHGQTLLEGAQEALTRLVELLPDGANVGLRVYGHRVPSTDQVNGCVDTELIVPVGPLDRNSMIEAIGGFEARGYTPIGLSLQEAANDLPPTGGTIVLVSDGEDTCAPPDPCEVAADLIAQGIDVQVHTVGFFLEGDDAARLQLECIADQTGGEFRAVDAIDPLVAELGNLIRIAIPGVGRVQLPIQGSLKIALAPTLPLGPPYDDRSNFFAAEGSYELMLRPGETRWYAIDLEQGQEIDVYGPGEESQFPTADEGESFEVTILDSRFEDARETALHRGVPEVLLRDFGPDGPTLGASTAREYAPWDELEPSMLRSIEYQGYDRATYEAAWLAAALEPREAEQVAGRYYVGFTWESEREPVDLGLGFGVSIIARGERFGTDYTTVDGAPSAEGAVLIEAPGFDPYEFPPGEHPSRRGLYVGEIGPGETRWYRHSVEADEAVQFEARLIPRGEAAPAGTLQAEIYDADFDPIGHEYVVPWSFDAGTGRSTASMAFSGNGVVPAAVSGDVYLAVSWTASTGGAADVRLVVDVVPRYPEGVTPPYPTTTSPPDRSVDPSPVVGSEGGDAGIVLVVVAGALVAGGVGLAGWLRYRRRRRSG